VIIRYLEIRYTKHLIVVLKLGVPHQEVTLIFKLALCSYGALTLRIIIKYTEMVFTKCVIIVFWLRVPYNEGKHYF